MPMLMMSGRELRHVPADFDCPIGSTWDGWFNPDGPLECEPCDGIGYSPTARWLHDTFYAHHTSRNDNHWGNKLVQGDLDALLAAGRLDQYVGRSLPTAAHPHGVPHRMRPTWLTPDDLNGERHMHDGINVHILVRHRCGLLGAAVTCEHCDGHGVTYRDDAHREACEAWDPEPPTGDHIQLWQTVSEGGPVSPIFPESAAGRVELATWLAERDESIHSHLTATDWLRLMGADFSAVDIHTGTLETSAVSSSPRGEQNDG